MVMELAKQTVFTGKVVHGRKVGRTIGFPTANLQIDHEELSSQLLGVHGVRVKHESGSYNGVMNVGRRPTFKGEKPTISVEVHILDFTDMIYGDQLQVETTFYIRDEMAFGSVEQLIQRLHKDVDFAKRGFSSVSNRLGGVM